jgi:predicted small metal-binding protein
MRVMECACGERLQAEDDERLFERVREHMDREHPEKGIEDEHVHNLIEATAHDDAEDTQSRP